MTVTSEISAAVHNLTELQVAVLAREYNMADGHAYRAWSQAEMDVIDSTPEKFRQVDRREYKAIEAKYFDCFYALGRQTLDTDHFERFPCFTASSGIEIIANYLRLNELSVTLIEPCFDNLKDILRRHQIPLTVFPEQKVATAGGEFQQFLESIDTDVIFLVSPNNPSGVTIARDNLVRIAEFCREQGKTLILDTCFRFYLPFDEVYDQYRIIIDADVDCIFIEDTGKTWPTVELKAPFIAVSKRLVEPIARINSDFLLHVSPFTMAMMTDFLWLSRQDGLAHIREVIAANRSVLYTELSDTFLEPVERPFMSVSWVKINAPISSEQLTATLQAHDVHVLPGNHFFWSDESQGDNYLRIALSRDPDTFSRGAARLGEICRSLTSVAPQ